MKAKQKDQHHHRASLKDVSKIRKIPHHKSNSVKYLEQLANEAARAKYPNTPPECLAPRKFRDDSANGLTNCIIQYIRLIGGQAERISNTGRQISQCKHFEDVVGFQRTIINTHWIPGTGTNGTADISATINVRSVKIEVKHGSDKQSKAQHIYQCQIEQAGGIYFIASSFEQFYHWHQLTIGRTENDN